MSGSHLIILKLIFLSTFLSVLNSVTTGTLGAIDPSSYSNPHEVVVSHIKLILDVNFKRKILAGRAELSCQRKIENAKNLILDSKDLVIKNVTSDTGEKFKFTLSEPYKTFGSALSVQIPIGVKNSNFKVIIAYETTPRASGLQWLTPEQTMGKKEPYMLSQFQAINARSAVPCQDTPTVKFTYSAEISAPAQLTALMSALRDGEPKDIDGDRRLTKFRQPLSIPSYLLAFAVGRITSRRLNEQISVWAEPETIEAAAYEFAETDKMLNTAIDLCGPYEWGVYDLLIMPPSFPFGGMENPCLTFVTPTLLVGDRSLVNLVAHEISHSWSGNLVTSRTFEDFWLNEGWTVFIERKILGKLHGSAERHFKAIEGLQTLKETVETTLGRNNEFTKLVPSLKDTDLDDAFSSVPYEKGHTFLFYLEELVGGPDAFNPFIKAYFAHFRKQSIATADFKDFFMKYFHDKKAVKKIEWDKWLYSTGMPPVMPQYDHSLSDASVQLAEEWRQGAAGRAQADIKSWSSEQIILFLTKLLEGSALPRDSVRKIGKLYELDKFGNSEVRFRWIRLGLKAHASEFVEKALEFVNKQGRMKFVRPIYHDLYHWKEKRKHAIDNYQKHKHTMMFVVSNQLQKDLHLT